MPTSNGYLGALARPRLRVLGFRGNPDRPLTVVAERCTAPGTISHAFRDSLARCSCGWWRTSWPGWQAPSHPRLLRMMWLATGY